MKIHPELAALLLERKSQIDSAPVISIAAKRECEDIIAPVERRLLSSDTKSLPDVQRLCDYKEYSVFYAYKHQAENVVREIARLRELVYRGLDEGSGKCIDTDSFDDTYIHLFVYDHNCSSIVGAYRFGQSDVLTERFGSPGMYLSQMFDFSETFKKNIYPALEMGRSFIAQEYQNRPYSLFLLWKGIGAYLLRHPRYRSLYGTVSLSNQYHPLSVSMMDAVLAINSSWVIPLDAFESRLGEQLTSFVDDHSIDFNALAQIVQFIEEEKFGVPVMLKHYYRVGARFLCTGVDKNFSGTPGLLLDVYMPEGPAQAFSGFFSKQDVEYYNTYTGGDNVE